MKLTVHGMMCMHCVKSVTDALNGLEGVSEVAVDLPTKTVTLAADESLRATVIETIEELGFEAE